MKKLILSIKTIALLAIISFVTVSCGNDNLEDLESSNACDTINVTYGVSIQPIIQNTCSGCHNVSNPSGGVNLSDYTNIKVAAENGSLLGTIRHKSGWEAMPKGGNKMSDCNIRKIEIWINEGTLNN